MQYLERITSNANVMLGKPVIKGTRITVEIILKKLSEGATSNDVIEMYPHLTVDDVNAALFYASEVISREEVISVTQ